MTIENPPAFPSPEIRGYDGMGICAAQYGMSLRDWFAGQALAGLYASRELQVATMIDSPPANGGGFERIMSDQSYRQADAMLAARAKSGEA